VFKVQYYNKIKYVLRLTQLSFILLFLLLATSFGLNRPSSGQHNLPIQLSKDIIALWKGPSSLQT